MAEVGRHAASTASDVVEYLHLTGRRYREHVELLRQEQALREARHTPFRPRISSYAEQVGKTSIARQSSSIGERLHELHRKKLALLEEEALETARQREEEAAKQCSFSPTVTSLARRVHRSDGDVTVELEKWATESRARRTRAQIEAARRELSTMSATPRITAYAEEKASAERGGLPIEVSLIAEAEARRRRRCEAFERTYPNSSGRNASKVGLGSSRSFTPRLSPYASRMEFQEDDVVSRLYEPHSSRSRSGGLQADAPPRRRLFDEEVALHCTFHPKLSAQSARLSRRHYEKEGEVNTDPHERLFRRGRRASQLREGEQSKVATGHPQISEASRRIVEERRHRLAAEGDSGALLDSPCNRLYHSAKSGAEAAHERKERMGAVSSGEVEEPLTFKPSVSPASTALWRHQIASLKASGLAGTTAEARQLLWRKTEQRKEEEVLRLREQQEREAAEACTFHPRAGRPPHRRSGYASMTIEARTTLWAQQRDRRLAILRSEQQETSTAQCTFTPHVDPTFPLPREDAQPAWGVESFVERLAEARRQRQEAEEWWRPRYARTPAPQGESWRRNRHVRLAPTPSASRHGAARSSSRASLAAEDDDEESEEFEPHWTRPPPQSTSLTASSFSRASHLDIPSADSSATPTVRRHAEEHHPSSSFNPAARAPHETRAEDPFKWSNTTKTTAEKKTSRAVALAWSKPLRYLPIATTSSTAVQRPPLQEERTAFV